MTKLIEVKHLKKQFATGKTRVTALFDINFEIHKNETLALVGESGSGKSLIAKILLLLEKKESGQIVFNNQDLDTINVKELKEFRRKMQIIFQDPYASLNPKMKIKEIIGEPLEIHRIAHGRSKDAAIDELLDQVNLSPDFKDRYPHEFSGGQRQRIGIARALSLNPEFIICDEPVSALDVSIQAQIINLLKKLQTSKGLTYLFISHDLSIVKYISHRVMVLYLGHIVEIGSTDEIYTNPLHPYTQALLASIPHADPILEKKRETVVLKGEIPSIFNPPSGCPFHPRCPKANDRCRKETPKVKEISQGRFAMCHLFD